MRKYLIFGLTALFLFAPFFVFAADPLIPDKFFQQGFRPQDVQACDLFQVANNLIRFAIQLAVAAAALMFAYAGFLYVTASAAGEEQLRRARKIFGYVFLGLVVVLIAWIVIDLVLTVFTGKGFGKRDIPCVSAIEQEMPTDTSGDLVTNGQPSTEGLVRIDSFDCKNQDSCEVSVNTNIKLAQMASEMRTQGIDPSQFQITEAGTGQTVQHASGSTNLDISCFGPCSPEQVATIVNTWGGRAVYETNNQSDVDAALAAGVPSSNILGPEWFTGTFQNGVCSTGSGHCITAPHISLNSGGSGD